MTLDDSISYSLITRSYMYLFGPGDQRGDDDTTNSTCSLEDEGELLLQNEKLSKRKKKRYSSQVLMENWDYENMYPEPSNDTTCNHCYPCSFFCKEVS